MIIIMEPLFFSVCPAGKCTGRRSIFCQNILILIRIIMTMMMIDDNNDDDDDDDQLL